MKVLVTGASGFLGSHVAEQLSAAGHAVRALVRKTSNRKHLQSLKGVELAEGGVEDAARVNEAVAGVDAIVHVAGLVKARGEAEFFATNVQGTVNLIEAAKAKAPGLTRFVQVSSLEACGPSKDGSPVSIAQESPITGYGRSKLAAEKALIAARQDLPITILRPTAIYGPRDVEILEAFKSVKRGVLPLTGDGSGQYTFVYGPDCAKACLAAISAEVPSGSVFHISDGGVYTQRAMMEDIERAIGRRAFARMGLPLGVIKTASVFVEAYGKLLDKPVMLTREKANMLAQPYWVCSSKEAEEALGWKPEVTWPEGVHLAVKWYRENGWL
jgi:nucleoside-diphosphate-sugar epimerase